ncbi:tyrosine-type recombinase/integrase [Halarsenatibacter silvermanii]|nr:tyrosine-type recombinase/integrase [Halarsenatibacter silvermanii]
MEQPNPRWPTGERNLALLRLMLGAGLRLSETTGLKWKRVDLRTGRIEVREGKGGKDRMLWCGDGALDALRSWRQRQTEEAGRELEHAFTAMSGGALGNPLDNRYAQEMVKRYAEKAGIEKRVTPHTLRHTFATDLLNETGNVRMVQKALGHARLSSTMIYTHVADADLEEALKGLRS